VIQDTCDNIDAANTGFIGQLGRGRINAFRAASQAFWAGWGNLGASWHVSSRLRKPWLTSEGEAC
jgi:hypothetical protein